MSDQFSSRARKVTALANQEATRFNHEYIGTEHILLGLVKEGSGVGARAIRELGLDLRKIRVEVEKLVKVGPAEKTTVGKLPQTPRAKKVIEYALEEVQNLRHTRVGTEHLLLGLIREHDGVAARVLRNLNLKLENVRDKVLEILATDPKNAEAVESVRTGAQVVRTETPNPPQEEPAQQPPPPTPPPQEKIDWESKVEEFLGKAEHCLSVDPTQALAYAVSALAAALMIKK